MNSPVAAPPRPYLQRWEMNIRLAALGFEFQFDDDVMEPDNPGGWALKPDQQHKFIALQELMAGFLAEWVDLELDKFDPTASWEQVEAELKESTEQYLVG